jgi:carboxypeptidase family protein
VTPAKSGYTFTPPNQGVSVTNTSVTNVNFSVQPVVISGTITPTATGAGTTVTLSGAASATATANGSGVYSFSAVADGSYTVTPSKSGYTFTPASQPVTISGGVSATTVNFTANPVPTYSISGTITPSANGNGATVTLSGAASATVTADASGGYTFTGLLNGSYTVTPSKPGFSMSPASQPATVNGGNVTLLPFTANSTGAAIDVTVSTDRSTTATTIASPAFTTHAPNELMLALVAADNLQAAATAVTGITGGGATWVLVQRTNTQKGTAEIWRAFAPAALTNATATATLNQAVAASMTIMTFSGVDTTGTNGSGAIGATGSGNALSGAPTATLTTTRANSLVVGVGIDWDNATSRTPAANQTVVHEYLATVGDTYWMQRTTNLVPASGTLVTITDTAPTGDRYNLTICEILAGS